MFCLIWTPSLLRIFGATFPYQDWLLFIHSTKVQTTSSFCCASNWGGRVRLTLRDLVTASSSFPKIQTIANWPMQKSLFRGEPSGTHFTGTHFPFLTIKVQ